MKILQTPDERFLGLPDWPYEPKYTILKSSQSADAINLRIHHIDTGAGKSGETILCMHGEPSWSFLYRKMMASHIAAGHRVIAPDLIGFGRSDKPLDTSEYTYERHVAWMNEWLNKNDFHGMTFVGQDWGGLVGLRVVTANVDRFDRICIANTGLPTYGREPTKAFRDWQKFSNDLVLPKFLTTHHRPCECFGCPHFW